jgi:excisionase family DNA binding protein
MNSQANNNILENDLDLLNIEGAARRLRMSTRNLWDLVHSGSIPYVRLGRLYRFIPADLEAYIKAHRIG